LATEVLSDISTALSQLFAPKLARQYNREAVLAKSLTVKPGRGKNVAWDAEFSGATAATFTEGADVSDGEFTTDLDKPATLSWGLYRAAFKLSGLEIDAAASSMGSPEELLDIVGARIESSMSKLVATINADLFTGTTGIVGLVSALAASGTYANLSRATYAEWQSNVLGNSGTARALSFDLLAQAEQNVFDDCGQMPDLIVVDAGAFRKYESLFEPVRRVDAAGSYNTGATQLAWRGIPVVRDRNCPSGKLFMLNTGKIEYQYLPSTSAADSVPGKVVAGAGSNGDAAEPTGIPVKIEPLARLGDAYKFQLVTRGQLCVKRPNACAVIEDISVS
jgi:hypothetical protein